MWCVCRVLVKHFLRFAMVFSDRWTLVFQEEKARSGYVMLQQDTDTDTNTQTHTDRQTDRQTDTHTHTWIANMLLSTATAACCPAAWDCGCCTPAKARHPVWVAHRQDVQQQERRSGNVHQQAQMKIVQHNGSENRLAAALFGFS